MDYVIVLFHVAISKAKYSKVNFNSVRIVDHSNPYYYSIVVPIAGLCINN